MQQVMRPVIVWITVVGLPLQCWGKEEVLSLTAPFGKLRKISSNFFQKTSADAFKIMVEVDDISFVPKVVKCSYKGVRDSRIRFYNVELFPSSICLPVSQCDAVSFRLYEEEGGSGECDEEGWSNGSEAEARGILREALKQAAADKEAGMVGGEAEIADPFAAEAQAQFTSAAAHEGGAVVQEHADISAGERERRRKGKEVIAEEGVKPYSAERIPRTSPQDSGSGSWDPLLMGAHQEHVGESRSSEDADSRASFEEVKGQDVLPREVDRRQDEDLDLGGEGAKKVQVRPLRVGGSALAEGGTGGNIVPREKKCREADREKKGTEVGSGSRFEGKPDIVISDGSDEGSKKEKPSEKDRSKGSCGSVPPGFQRIHKPRQSSQSGGLSPFGNMQKGGLRFLKRPASSASSGARSGPVAAPKKNKP